MDRRLRTYLRTLRRRWGLTQKELAFLIGASGGDHISRVEQLKRLPSLAAAIACIVIFDASPYGLFPGLFEEIEESVLKRATELYNDLQGDPKKSAARKLDFLEEVLKRAQERRHDADV
jgi:transcriptional regulator with XRE-family HTH domain